MRVVAVTVGTSLLRNAGGRGLPDFLRSTEPAKACAETNTLYRLLEGGERLVFLHSETEEGRACAQALCSFYSERGHEAETRLIPGLRYDEERSRGWGLGRWFMSWPP